MTTATLLQPKRQKMFIHEVRHDATRGGDREIRTITEPPYLAAEMVFDGWLPQAEEWRVDCYGFSFNAIVTYRHDSIRVTEHGGEQETELTLQSKFGEDLMVPANGSAWVRGITPVP
jgi:hypothetical protein